MQITLCGAAGEVTGSAYLVRTKNATVLVDIGMFQGENATEERNRDLGPIDPRHLDAVLLTHAHLDHTGRLPLLAARGFRSNVYCTPATEDFARIILMDSAQLQESDADRKNKKRERAGQKLVQPLYRKADVERLNPLLRNLNLGEHREVADGIAVKYYEAGHILGSTSIEMTVQEDGATKTIVFSGDLGPLNSPILNDFDPPPRADLVFQETTYGSRDHRSFVDTIQEFRGLLAEAVARQRKILIPAFAIGRSQTIIYEIACAVQAGAIPAIPVYLDSPMAIEAMDAYLRHRDLHDADAREHHRTQDLRPTMDRLTLIRSVDESRSLNDKHGPMVIIAGSGMCDGGRIVHHLRNNLYKPTTTVIIVGYQTHGSLGHRLVTGAKEVRIFGERVAVRSDIHTLGGFSGHAGKTDLLTWANGLAKTKPRWILTHGEPESRETFRKLLQGRFGIAAECPKQYDTVELH